MSLVGSVDGCFHDNRQMCHWLGLLTDIFMTTDKVVIGWAYGQMFSLEQKKVLFGLGLWTFFFIIIIVGNAAIG